MMWRPHSSTSSSWDISILAGKCFPALNAQVAPVAVPQNLQALNRSCEVVWRQNDDINVDNWLRLKSRH